MNAKIVIGEVSFELTGATTSELIQFAREGNLVMTKPRDVVSVTREAITQPKKKMMNYQPWVTADIEAVAKLAVALGYDAKLPASNIAKAMQRRAGNKRSYATLYGTCYNIYRFLNLGKPGNLSKTTIADLEALGYTAGMMQNTATPSNMLGDVRHLTVQQA